MPCTRHTANNIRHAHVAPRSRIHIVFLVPIFLMLVAMRIQKIIFTMYLAPRFFDMMIRMFGIKTQAGLRGISSTTSMEGESTSISSGYAPPSGYVEQGALLELARHLSVEGSSTGTTMSKNSLALIESFIFLQTIQTLIFPMPCM